MKKPPRRKARGLFCVLAFDEICTPGVGADLGREGRHAFCLTDRVVCIATKVGSCAVGCQTSYRGAAAFGLYAQYPGRGPIFGWLRQVSGRSS